MRRYQYNCVSPNSEEELNYILDNMVEIDYDDFISNVSMEDVLELEKSFLFPLKDDTMVKFFECELSEDKTAYLFSHSAIEYIFY